MGVLWSSCWHLMVVLQASCGRLVVVLEESYGHLVGASLTHSLARLGCNFMQPVDLCSLWICAVLVIYTGGRGVIAQLIVIVPPQICKR